MLIDGQSFPIIIEPTSDYDYLSDDVDLDRSESSQFGYGGFGGRNGFGGLGGFENLANLGRGFGNSFGRGGFSRGLGSYRGLGSFGKSDNFLTRKLCNWNL